MKLFWEKINYKYKISIVDETTYKENYKFRLSRFQIMAIFSLFSAALVYGGVALIFYTQLKEYIPGYPTKEERLMLLVNYTKVMDLEQKIHQRDLYLQSLFTVFSDTSRVSDREARDVELSKKYDSLELRVSEDELLFRQEIEEKEKFNLGITPKENLSEFLHFFPPVDGYISQKFDDSINHFGIDIVTDNNAKVKASLDGVVIFADWTINTGYVIQIQHSNDLISVYKHNSILYKKQGDYVTAGEIIATIGNTGELTSGTHLHFELWQKGVALNPSEYIKFEEILPDYEK